jgi:hypothetical protein
VWNRVPYVVIRNGFQTLSETVSNSRSVNAYKQTTNRKENPMEGQKKQTTERKAQNNLVLSLPPGDDGKRMKESLRKLAGENHRSLSNQVSVILREYLKEENRL